MATIKSYTDLSQSKVLAKILPLESADMEYLAIKENGALVGTVPFVKDDSEVEDSAYSHTYDRIACWNLAALLSVLTKNKICHYDDRYYCQYISEGDEFTIYSTAAYNNPVNACVEMIIKLHELNKM